MEASSSNMKPRNREATRALLIAAVGSLLAREGFKALGVNAVAREAGVDKVLIYRYFGGLPELITAFGQGGDFWPSIAELAGGDVDAYRRLPLERQLTGLARNFLRALRNRPLTQEILAWEMVERNELTAVLEAIRETTMLRFYQMFFPSIQEELDMEAVSAIIGAGTSYLVSRARKIRYYSGIDLESEEGWRRLENALDVMVRGVVAGSGP